METQKGRVGAEIGPADPAVPAPSPPSTSTADTGGPSRRDTVIIVVYGVIAAMAVALALWRFMGDHDHEPTRAPSALSAVDVGADGSVDVVQRIDFATPRSSVTVSVPVRRISDLRFGPRVGGLHVRADGHDVAGISGPLREGETRSITLPEAATYVVLSYSVEDAVASTRPSTQGRALALVTPLSIEGTANVRSRITIDRHRVLNIGCAPAGGPLTACGSETRSRWVVARRADDPVVDIVAQIDLPD